VQSADRPGRPQLQLSLRLPAAQPHPRPNRSSLFSSLVSLSISVFVCPFHMHKNIREFRFQKKSSRSFGQRRTAAAAAALHTFSSWPSRPVQRSSSSRQQRSSQDNQSSRVFSPTRPPALFPLLHSSSSARPRPASLVTISSSLLIVCSRVLGPVPPAAGRPAEFTCGNPFVFISSNSVWPIRLRDVGIVNLLFTRPTG